MAVSEETDSLPFECAANACHSSALTSHGKGTASVGGQDQLQIGDFEAIQWTGTRACLCKDHGNIVFQVETRQSRLKVLSEVILCCINRESCSWIFPGPPAHNSHTETYY